MCSSFGQYNYYTPFAKLAFSLMPDNFKELAYKLFACFHLLIPPQSNLLPSSQKKFKILFNYLLDYFPQMAIPPHNQLIKHRNLSCVLTTT